MPDDNAILVDIDSHVAVLTMNNPPANTWTTDSLVQLRQIVETLNEDKNVYALVIIGAGERSSFRLGADLKLFASGDKTVAVEMAQLFGHAFETLSAFRGGLYCGD